MDKKIRKVLNSTFKSKHIFGIVINIESGDGSISYKNSIGNLNNDSTYAIASITKMYTTSVILKLVSQGKLKLEDKINKYLSKDILSSLHVYNNIEYSNEITINHLLSHNSGLPDYYEEKSVDGKSCEDLFIDKDMSFTFNDKITRTKILKSHFIPGKKNKAFYSDINFDLLGVIIEKVTNKDLNQAFNEFIFKPLNLINTYLFSYNTSKSFSPIYHGKIPLHRPLSIASSEAEGGLISNAEENMIFLKAFFSGKIFPKEYLNDLYKWNRLQWFLLEYGVGIMRLKLSRLMSPILATPEILGHSGSTGTFAFYCPSKDLYITGAFNQLKKHPFSLIYRLINCF